MPFDSIESFRLSSSSYPFTEPTFGTPLTSSSGLSLAGFSEQSSAQRSGTVLTGTRSTRSISSATFVVLILHEIYVGGQWLDSKLLSYTD
jgi:hypothetical protein